MPSAMAERTRKKYRGAIAANYERQRASDPKWQAEERVLREMLGPWQEGTKLLDIPVGTGRFLPWYAAKGFIVTGMDVSPDMIGQARERAGSNVDLRIGDIFATGLMDNAVDVSVCVRIMNLISREDMQAALREVQRVTREAVIFNLRVWHAGTKYRRPQRLEDVQAALLPGWTVAENREIHQHDFRMFRLSCAS